MKPHASAYLVLSSILLIFYGTVMYFALHPKVSDGYRAYFIEKTREVMDDDGTWLRPVNPGQWIAHDSNDVGYSGFSGVEPDFRWSSKRNVSLLIDVVCTTDWKDVVKIKLSSNGKQRAMFSLNGGVEVAQIVEPDQAQIDLQFADGAIKCGNNRLDIELPDARAPSAQDTRELGLAFRAVAVE